MKINKIHPNIYEIENFISIEEQEKILNLILLGGEDSWNNDGSNDKDSFWIDKTANIMFLHRNIDLINIFYKRIQTLYESYADITGIGIHRYKINDYLNYHIDNYYTNNKDEYYIKYGMVLYYNDDYIGGELHYKNLNIIHKPNARSLIIHGGNIEHGTKPVLGGSARYFSTCFAKGTKEQPVILNKKLFSEIGKTDDATQ